MIPGRKSHFLFAYWPVKNGHNFCKNTTCVKERLSAQSRGKVTSLRQGACTSLRMQLPLLFYPMVKIFIENNLRSSSYMEFLYVQAWDTSMRFQNQWKMGKEVNIYYTKAGKKYARKCTCFIIHALNSSFLLKRVIRRYRFQIRQAKCNYLFLTTIVMQMKCLCLWWK